MHQSKVWLIAHSAGQKARQHAWHAELSLMKTANINSSADNID